MTLKLELDKANKIKNEITDLRFIVMEEPDGMLKLMATTGQIFKLLLEKERANKWRMADSNQYVNLGNWIAQAIKYEESNEIIQNIFKIKINQLYHDSNLE